ncbi:hypothetical protein YTPLAS18_21210 [Nitrospira sp.]|nr:hypothetical protein YTPLAS18_21210 [Nitrospira sp.]
MRIWYQSFVDPAEQGPYFRELEKALATASDQGITFDLKGLSPPDRELSRLTELRCTVQVVRNALLAQEQGYDAFAIGHFQDGGLYEARAAVDIPVLSLGETSMLYACTLGHSIGVVTIHPVFIAMIQEQITRYGLHDRIVGVRAITSSPEQLVRANDDATAFKRFLVQFGEAAQPLIDQGVEIIIPGGGLPAMLLSRKKGYTLGNGIPVLEPIAVLAKMTAVAVQLRRLNGTGPNRVGTFAKASAQAVQEFLKSW